MVDKRIDTPEMLMSQMERGQHRAGMLRSALSFGSKAGNDELCIIDVSYWQDHNRIDYDLLSKNIHGVILRGSYGIWKDTRFDIHYDEFYKRGVPIGSYCYIIGNLSGRDQAEAFHAAVGKRELRLKVYADIEDQRPNTALTRDVSDRFVRDTDALFNLQSRIYTGPYAWRAIMGHNNTSYSNRFLWVANYMVNNPMLPIGGGWTQPNLWQWTEHGRLPGYHSNLDLNRWFGTTEEYWADVGETSPPVIDPDPSLPPSEDAMYRIEMLGNKTMRDAPNGRELGGSHYALAGEIHESNKRQGDWYQIARRGQVGWIYAGGVTHTRVTIINAPADPVPPGLTVEERLDRIEEHLGLT